MFKRLCKIIGITLALQAFVMVAFVMSLLAHVPPDVGAAVIVEPIHTEVAEVDTIGKAFTVTTKATLSLSKCPFTDDT